MVEDHPLTRAGIKAITAYTDKPRAGTNLANNSSLFPLSPRVAAAVAGLSGLDLRAYPERGSRPLREALADLYGVGPDQVITANSSNDAIDLAIRCVTEPGSAVAYTPPTFEMFPRAIQINGARPVEVPLGADFGLPVDALVRANARLTLVASPNNPTGNAFPPREIARVADGVDGIVLVDEAYGEFNQRDALALLERDDVIVTRTFSKAYGLAGARVGYAIAPPAIARALDKARGPYRLNAIAERLALAALEDQDHLRRVVAEVRSERERVAAAVARLGLDPAASDASFLFCRHAGAGLLEGALEKRGFLVRAFGPPIADRFRFTIAPRAVNDRFLAALQEALVEVPP